MNQPIPISMYQTKPSKIQKLPMSPCYNPPKYITTEPKISNKVSRSTGAWPSGRCHGFGLVTGRTCDSYSEPHLARSGRHGCRFDSYRVRLTAVRLAEGKVPWRLTFFWFILEHGPSCQRNHSDVHVYSLL